MQFESDYEFKLGLDLHGVVDKCPDKFVYLAAAISNMGGEVIICTGSRNDKKLEEQLLAYGGGFQWWDSIFSITDYLIKTGIQHITNDDGGISIQDPITWDKVKGDWARENNISLHIDDSPAYGQYFPEDVFLKFNERTERSRAHTKLELVPSIHG